jgi:hypothetical protein
MPDGHTRLILIGDAADFYSDPMRHEAAFLGIEPTAF